MPGPVSVTLDIETRMVTVFRDGGPDRVVLSPEEARRLGLLLSRMYP